MDKKFIEQINIPNEIIGQIYSYDRTFKEKYDKVILSIPKNSSDFLDDLINNVSAQVANQDINYDNPMSAVITMINSGIFTNLVSTLSTNMENGTINTATLMGCIKLILNKLESEI